MNSRYRILSPRFWKDYELIDCGGFEKLERFGSFILSRPEPQAIWDKKLPPDEWDRLWNARYVREKGRDNPLFASEKGKWTKKPGMKDRWAMRYSSPQLDLLLNLSLTSFGHVGIFPEQAESWEFIYESVQSLSQKKEGQERETPRVLNLFAYTGASTLAACAAGAEVVHVDSVKQVVNWASENKQSSKAEGLTRWIIDDAMKFVKREVRRSNRYHGIILDPPAYGRGPQGEKWLLDRDLNEMMKSCSQLLHPERNFFLLNVYSVGFSALILDTLVTQEIPGNDKEIGELALRSATEKMLPLGVFVRLGNYSR